MAIQNTTERQLYYRTIARNGTEGEICIMSPDDNCMALIWFPGYPDSEEAQSAKADADRIVDALNSYTRPGAGSVAKR